MVTRWLGLDDDLRPFLALVAADPPVAALIDEVAGLHQVRFRSLAEGTTYFALTQRSTQWFATARKRCLAGLCLPAGTCPVDRVGARWRRRARRGVATHHAIRQARRALLAGALVL
jgi:hypothetical protein